MKHSGTRRFEAERLIVRRFVPDDWRGTLDNWIADTLVRHEYGEPVYADDARVKALLNEYPENYARPDFCRWAIIEKKNGANIGQIAFCRAYGEICTAEIECCIGRGFQGNGYAGEAPDAPIRRVGNTAARCATVWKNAHIWPGKQPEHTENTNIKTDE